MKIFEGNVGYDPNRVNFVDENNVFVGFEIEENCCEDFGWFIAEEVMQYEWDAVYPDHADVSDYVFDVGFFESSNFEEQDNDQLEDGGMVVFRLTADGKPDLFLHLYNSHNGYYSHA